MQIHQKTTKWPIACQPLASAELYKVQNSTTLNHTCGEIQGVRHEKEDRCGAHIAVITCCDIEADHHGKKDMREVVPFPRERRQRSVVPDSEIGRGVRVVVVRKCMGSKRLKRGKYMVLNLKRS